MATSRLSSRSSACREALSGPWHEKQFSNRMGRTSRLYRIAVLVACAELSTVHAHDTSAMQVTIRRVKGEFMPCGCRLGGVLFGGKIVRLESTRAVPTGKPSLHL